MILKPEKFGWNLVEEIQKDYRLNLDSFSVKTISIFSKMSSYKTCAVPMCKSTRIKTPNKLFIHVPKCPELRKNWLQLARRDLAFTSKNSTIYFCEDHFDLEQDMENFVRYKLMGSVKQIKMKPNCLPSRFDCQKDRKFKAKVKPRAAFLKRRKIEILEEALSTPQIQQTAGTSAQPIKKPVEDPQQLEDFVSCQSSSREKNYMEININDNSADSTDSAESTDNSTTINIKQVEDPQQLEDFVSCQSSSREKNYMEININDNSADSTDSAESTDNSTTINIKQELLSSSSPEQTYDCSNHDGTMFELEIDTKCEVKQEQTEVLYADHEIKEEMVIGPVVLQDAPHVMEDNAILLGKKKSSLKAQDDKTEQKETNLIESRDEMKHDINLKCKECKFQASTQASLERHKRLHDKKRRFVCDLCGYRYTLKTELQEHLKTSHKNISEIFECNICGYKTNMIFELDMHVRTVHEPLSHDGPMVEIEMDKICEVKLEETEEVYAVQEIKQETAIEPVVQAVPHVMEESSILLGTRKSSRLKAQKEKTDQKGKKHYFDDSITADLNIKDITTKSKKINKKLKNSNPSYKIPETILSKDTGIEPVTSYNNRDKHLGKTGGSLMKIRKKKLENYLKCKECSQQTITPASLERHEVLHDRKRRFVCDVCRYRFKEKTELQEHMNTNHKNFSAIFECSICGYKTNMIFELNMHLKIHEKE